MLLKVAQWLAETWIKIWNLLMDSGYIGMSIILIPILRKLVSIMRQFTN